MRMVEGLQRGYVSHALQYRLIWVSTFFLLRFTLDLSVCISLAVSVSALAITGMMFTFP